MISPAHIGAIAAARFVGGGGGGDWFPFVVKADGGSSDISGGGTLRVNVNPSEFPDGEKFRVTLYSSLGFATTVAGACVGHAISVGAKAYRGTPVPVTFNGGSAGVTIPADSEVVSDEITFPVNGSVPLLFDVEFTSYTRNGGAAPGETNFRGATGLLGGPEAFFNGNANGRNSIRKMEVLEDIAPWADAVVVSPSGTSNFSGYQIRTVVDKSILIPGDTVRIALQAGSGGSMTNSGGVYVYYQAPSGNPYAFESTPIRATFGGTHSLNITASTEIVSDPIALPVDGTKNLLIAYYANVGHAADSTGVTGIRAYSRQFVSDSSVVDPTSAFTALADGRLVGLVRVQTR